MSSFACGATTGKDPRIRGPRLRLLQLLATRQMAATARTGLPKRRTRRLSKDSEFYWPRGHLSDVLRNEADYQPAQLARVSPMPANVPARAQPTTAPPGANTVTMPKPTPKPGPSDASSAGADVQVRNLLATDVDVQVTRTGARVIVSPVVGNSKDNAERIILSRRFATIAAAAFADGLFRLELGHRVNILHHAGSRSVPASSPKASNVRSCCMELNASTSRPTRDCLRTQVQISNCFHCPSEGSPLRTGPHLRSRWPADWSGTELRGQ